MGTQGKMVLPFVMGKMSQRAVVKMFIDTNGSIFRAKLGKKTFPGVI